MSVVKGWDMANMDIVSAQAFIVEAQKHKDVGNESRCFSACQLAVLALGFQMPEPRK